MAEHLAQNGCQVTIVTGAPGFILDAVHAGAERIRPGSHLGVGSCPHFVCSIPG
jgi:hypothetical protein